MTKSEFKKRWDKDDSGDGITFDDIAQCAIDWRLYNRPKTCDINKVLDAVLKAAHCTLPNQNQKERGIL